jgi:hypothetical protein
MTVDWVVHFILRGEINPSLGRETVLNIKRTYYELRE